MNRRDFIRGAAAFLGALSLAADALVVVDAVVDAEPEVFGSLSGYPVIVLTGDGFTITIGSRGGVRVEGPEARAVVEYYRLEQEVAA